MVRFREVVGIRMRWEEHGAGTPVILVHGIPTSPALWRRVLPHLTGARSLAWEMIGYGDSIAEGAGRNISVAAQAEYLLAWMEALGIRRAVLAGHDLGGGVVQIAAVREPARCAGLLLTNSIGYDSWPVPSVKLLRALGPLVRHLPSPVFKRGLLAMLMRRGHDNPAVGRESLELHARPYQKRGGAAAFIRQIKSLDVRDTERVAAELPRLRDIPSRVVWGAADQFQRLHYGERFARDLGAPLRAIAGGKHFTPEDHPEPIAEALNALVASAAAQNAT